MANVSPLPAESLVVAFGKDPQTGQPVPTWYMSEDWLNWLIEQQQRVDVSPEISVATSVPATNASISTTAILTPSSSQYVRISPYARIVTPATTSSSLTVTITWTDGGVVCTYSYPAVTGNTTASVLVGPPITVRSDQAAPVSYSTTYASNGAGEMAYELVFVAEAL